MPGIDELVGLVEIVRLSAGFEVVVVDTAPTGHALRLLAAPQAVPSLVRVLDALQRDHRIVRKQLARVDRPEAADRLIAPLAQQARTRASCCGIARGPRFTGSRSRSRSRLPKRRMRVVHSPRSA